MNFTHCLQFFIHSYVKTSITLINMYCNRVSNKVSIVLIHFSLVYTTFSKVYHLFSFTDVLNVSPNPLE